jgi:hypothetical protein
MNFKTSFAASFVLLLCLCLNAQTNPPRELSAKRTNLPVTIDGLLSDSAWKDAAVMTDFVEFRPKIGAKEAFENRTIAYLMYNDEGIYFGGYCYERTKDSIATELAGRDGFGTNDYVGLIFDTYYDKINGFEYFVTPLNEQWDAKMSPNNNGNSEDFSWNAVWQSGAVIHNDGWSFELFIPYAAIRFGKKEVQNWGLNVTRRRRKTEQQYTWNPIDPNVNGFLTQEGIWKGITNIKPPLRLQFSPYISVYANHYPASQPGQKNWTNQINGGMDVKYGINQAFTLDATLIPDFGQVQSDNQVLNLSPFEVRFNENRNFFTEGTELFSKGNLFYSRRIGGTPIHLYDAYNTGTNEKVIKNPTESKLVNASKISGRTQKGLGIGVLNAITKPQHAVIENIQTKEQFKFETDPLTNYNILVIDQTMKHNSSVSLVNTNVWRSGSDYDANVTAALFDLNNKKNMYNLGGKFAVSNLVGFQPDGKTLTGFSHELYFGKTSGRFNFNVSQQRTDTKFNSNDLGYFTNNNFFDHSVWVGYRWTEPKKWYNRIFLNFNSFFSVLAKKFTGIDPNYQTAFFNINTNIQGKKLWWLGGFVGYGPGDNDFYEPRKEGWFFKRGSTAEAGGWFNSNESKKYSFFLELFGSKRFNFYNGYGFNINVGQNIRVNNKLSFSHSLNLNPQRNNMGFATIDNNGDIIFSRRDRNTIVNTLSTKYSFSNKMWLTFRARHYTSSVDIKELYNLQTNGKLLPNTTFNSNLDQNVNFFNIDMVYTWQFAPGSFINIVWKNAVFDFDNTIQSNYFKNFERTMKASENNNISLKVIYFLDYLQLKNIKKKKA